MLKSAKQSLATMWSAPDRRARKERPRPLSPIILPSRAHSMDDDSLGDGDITPRAHKQMEHVKVPSPGAFYTTPYMAKSQPDLSASRRLPPVAFNRAKTSQVWSHGLSDAANKNQKATHARTPSNLVGMGQNNASLCADAFEAVEQHRVDSYGLKDEGPIRYAVDTKSVASGSMPSLSRGTSTISSVPSQILRPSQRDHVASQAASQDIFVIALALTPMQQKILLTGVRVELLQQYSVLYSLDFCRPEFLCGDVLQCLLQKREDACLRTLLPLHVQRAMVDACEHVLTLPGGEKRLLRVLRYALHGTLQEPYGAEFTQAYFIAALAPHELKELLCPLQLDMAQQALVEKYLGTKRQRVAARPLLQQNFR